MSYTSFTSKVAVCVCVCVCVCVEGGPLKRRTREEADAFVPDIAQKRVAQRDHADGGDEEQNHAHPDHEEAPDAQPPAGALVLPTNSALAEIASAYARQSRQEVRASTLQAQLCLHATRH